MGNLGFQYAYHILNKMDECVAERAFLPEAGDLEEYLKGRLFSYESLTPLPEFDIVAFSVSFEEDFCNIPGILTLAGMPVLSENRGEYGPLVMAGGVAVSLNPEPLSEIVDCFIIGEAEGALAPFIELYAGLQKKKRELIAGLDSLEYVYVPALYEFTYDGVRVADIRPLSGAKTSVKAKKNLDLDKQELPKSFIITPETGFKDTFLTEIERGCGRGCRFCAAGFVYLPPRFRPIEAVKDSVKQGMETTGKVGLVGTAVSEYPGLSGLLDYALVEGKTAGADKGGTITLSSLRLDCLDSGLLQRLKTAGYRTVTLAPEAGSLEMRNVVNKGMSDAEILDAVRLVTEAGFTKLKLYFLIGLPNEEDADAEAIVDISVRIRSTMKSGTLALSVNPFVPKPATPFQWHPFESETSLKNRLAIIKNGLKKTPGVTVKAMAPKEAFTQAYISRGDRRAGSFIMDAAQNGIKNAIRAQRKFMEESVYRQRTREEVLPWDLVDHGLNKDYLWTEYKRGLQGKLTPPCDVGTCFRCGVC
jgi:radical SAM superfamily enzyme YgiQ (UPF0313 family)